jgi:hypothetical protein
MSRVGPDDLGVTGECLYEGVGRGAVAPPWRQHDLCGGGRSVLVVDAVSIPVGRLRTRSGQDSRAFRVDELVNLLLEYHFEEKQPIKPASSTVGTRLLTTRWTANVHCPVIGCTPESALH